MNKFTQSLYMAFLTLLFWGNSNAALVTQNFTGEFLAVDSASDLIMNEPSLSSLSLAAAVSGSVTFEDTLVNEIGDTFLGYGAGVTDLALNFGALSFTHADDLDFGFGNFPEVDFFDGALTSVTFFTDYGDNGAGEPIWEMYTSGNMFQFFDFASGDVIASGVLNYAPAPVPVPPAVWLFGSGLIGLIGIARRRHQKL